MTGPGPGARPGPGSGNGLTVTVTACRRCTHPRDAHEHYRKGTECSLCDTCPRYRRWRLVWRGWRWRRG